MGIGFGLLLIIFIAIGMYILICKLLADVVKKKVVLRPAGPSAGPGSLKPGASGSGTPACPPARAGNELPGPSPCSASGSAGTCHQSPGPFPRQGHPVREPDAPWQSRRSPGYRPSALCRPYSVLTEVYRYPFARRQGLLHSPRAPRRLL